MESLVHAMLSNAVAAAILVVMVAIIGRTCRRPALIHGLCLVVMLKLVTPPLVPVSLPVGLDLAPETWSSGEAGEGSPESIAPAEMSQIVTAAAANEPWAEPGRRSNQDIAETSLVGGHGWSAIAEGQAGHLRSRLEHRHRLTCWLELGARCAGRGAGRCRRLVGTRFYADHAIPPLDEGDRPGIGGVADAYG